MKPGFQFRIFLTIYKNNVFIYEIVSENQHYNLDGKSPYPDNF